MWHLGFEATPPAPPSSGGENTRLRLEWAGRAEIVALTTVPSKTAESVPCHLFSNLWSRPSAASIAYRRFGPSEAVDEAALLPGPPATMSISRSTNF